MCVWLFRVHAWTLRTCNYVECECVYMCVHVVRVNVYVYGGTSDALQMVGAVIMNAWVRNWCVVLVLTLHVLCPPAVWYMYSGCPG